MLKAYKSTAISGKWRVYRWLSSDPKVKPYLPRTLLLTLGNLLKLADSFPVLYIKPNVGSQGKHIYRATRSSSGQYFVRSVKNTRQFPSITSVYQYLLANQPGQMIVQQGIAIESLDQKPYDIRVMVQRKPGGAWTCTGIFAKLGRAGKIVTNYYQGGKLHTMQHIYQKMGFSPAKRNERLKRLERVALRGAQSLSRKQSGMHEMGFDFAYDRWGRLWILEVNTNHPQFYPIKALDANMYNRMLSHAKSYGRFN